MLILEQVMGIEPTSQAWEAGILPMNYTRIGNGIIAELLQKSNYFLSIPPLVPGRLLWYANINDRLSYERHAPKPPSDEGGGSAVRLRRRERKC